VTPLQVELLQLDARSTRVSEIASDSINEKKESSSPLMRGTRVTIRMLG
jgi:hypothetical protein